MPASNRLKCTHSLARLAIATFVAGKPELDLDSDDGRALNNFTYRPAWEPSVKAVATVQDGYLLTGIGLWHNNSDATLLVQDTPSSYDRGEGRMVMITKNQEQHDIETIPLRIRPEGLEGQEIYTAKYMVTGLVAQFFEEVEQAERNLDL